MKKLHFSLLFITEICLLIVASGCGNKNYTETIKDANHITYSNMELNQFKNINGKSDTAIIIKDIFLYVAEFEPEKNISFRDATDLNKIVFYSDNKSVTAWINYINNNQFVFGIGNNKYILDSVNEEIMLSKFTTALGVRLTEN